MKGILGIFLIILGLVFILPGLVGLYLYMFGFRFFEGLESVIAFICTSLGIGFGALGLYLKGFFKA